MIYKNTLIRVLAIVLLLSVYSCSFGKSKIEEAIVTAYNECEQKSSCVIDFKEVISSDWDVMHVLGPAVGQALANKIIGFDYEEGKDANRLILFIKDKTVVQSQSDFAGFDDSNNSKIFFNQQTITNIKSSEAKFNIRYKEGVYTLWRD